MGKMVTMGRRCFGGGKMVEVEVNGVEEGKGGELQESLVEMERDQIPCP